MLVNKNTKKFLRLLNPYHKKIILITFFELLTIISSLIIPYILGEMIHSLEGNYATVKLLSMYFILVIGLYFIWDMSDIIINVKFSEVNKGIQNDLRTFCYDKILNAKMSILQNKSEGEILSKVIRDTEKVEKAFSNLFYIIISYINVAALIIMMIKINFILASILISIFLIVVIIQKISSKSLKKLYIKYKISEENLLGDLKNQISGFLTIKVFSLEKRCIRFLNKRNLATLQDYILLNKKSGIIKYFNFFITSIFRVTTVFIGGVLYIYNKINIGSIFSIYTYAIQLSTQLRMIIEIDIVLKDIITSFDRIIKFTEDFHDDCYDENLKLSSIDKIEFRNVSFKYNERTIFTNLTLEARKNDIIAVKGGNGSGKTTLTYIICGFYKPDNVYINNNEIRNISEKEILKRISYALQDTYLFPTSILENINCFGRVSEKDVYKVCNDLGIHNKIMALPNGYDTVVNENNLNLSGGEKQLITLARALLKESDILILDEINSALDSKLEREIFSNIHKYFDNKIVFIISHRESILDICNTKINLEEFKSI